MPTEVELKPCPFCGGTPRITQYMDEDIWTHNTVKWIGIDCDCGVSVDPWPESVANEEVYNVWNTRV